MKAANRWVIFGVLLAALSLSAQAAVTPTPQAKAAFDRGEKAFASGYFDDAVAAYTEALKTSPGWAPALNGLGSALFKQSKREEAIAQFRAATEADPQLKLAWFNLGYSSRKTNDFKTAAPAYERYTRLDPTDPDGFYGLAECYKALGENAKAIAAFESYLQKEKRPSEQKWVDKAKESITQLKGMQAAVAAPQTAPAAVAAPAAAPAAPVAAQPAPAAPAASLTPAASRRMADGDKLMGEKKYREASFAYQDAVNADPNNVEALFKLGNSYATLGYYAQAIDRWNRVVQLSGDPAVKKSAQDNVTRAQQRMAQAGPSPQAANKAPGSGPVADSTRTQARRYYEQGVQLITGRDYANALANLSAAVQLEPTLTVGYVARGSALIGLRRFQEAALDYGYAHKLDPNMAAPLYGMAESYRGLGRPGDARAWYEKYAGSAAPDVRTDLVSDARAKIDQLKGN